MNDVRLIFLPAILLLASGVLRGQNLVPNGSFEEYLVCPGSYSDQAAAFRVPSWTSLSTGSPDYFNACSRGEADVPYNWAGVSDAFDGSGYAGIYMWMNLSKEYREYLHCRLSTPLIRDSVYLVSFRYKLSSYSKYSTDRIAMLLSDSLRRYRHDGPLDITPTFTFVKDSALTPETGAWELALTEYKARGGEQYITIGNFSDNAGTRAYHIRFRPTQEPMLQHSAYYYIDDVKVLPRFAAHQVEIPVLSQEDPDLNTVYVLENIEFAFNSHVLLPSSYSDLDRVVEYMQRNPAIKVVLSGHTDDMGGYDYNLRLSDARAESVAAYLIAAGTDRERIFTRGFGESKPLIDAFTEEARKKNRRVEIEFRQ